MLFETLWAAVDAAQEELKESKAVLEEPDRIQYWFGGIPYGQVAERHEPIKTLKGRKTGKWFHMIITRMESGRYELVTYIL
jgi:hypothetical protein